MSVTAADIKALPSGEFASVADGVITPIITEAELQLSESTWGDYYDSGVLYLAAHLLAVLKKGGTAAAGPVVSERAGPVARTYAQSATASGNSYETTAYGQRFIQLQRIVAGSPRVL